MTNKLEEAKRLLAEWKDRYIEAAKPLDTPSGRAFMTLIPMIDLLLAAQKLIVQTEEKERAAEIIDSKKIYSNPPDDRVVIIPQPLWETGLEKIKQEILYPNQSENVLQAHDHKEGGQSAV
jgi:hypothetical protein